MQNVPTNTQTNAPTTQKFSAFMQQPMIKNLIQTTLSDSKKAERFSTSIISAVSINPALQKCDFNTIITGALLGECLDLSPSPQLGQFYLVPYGNKAIFQLGYKGYTQLAIRSGQYKNINVIAIKEGELIAYNRLTEEIEAKFIEDENEREKAKTIGFCAMFELVNGFKKTIYWTKEKMVNHAKKYSKSYNSSNSFWKNHFEEMAFKTMLRQLISKWGIMSIEMRDAFENDSSFKDEKGNVVYPDSMDEQPEIIDLEPIQVEEMNEQTETIQPIENETLENVGW